MNFSITINTSVYALNHLLSTQKYLNGFEFGCLDDQDRHERRQTEFEVLSIPISTDDSKRPIYGAAWVNPSKNGGAEEYGPVCIVLNDSVKQRSTFTHHDSYVVTKGDVRTIDGFGDCYFKFLMENPNDYIECQIFGGITVYDIKEILINLELSE